MGKKPNRTDEDQSGRITFTGKLATQFWVRTLGLEKDVEEARVLMGAKTKRKWGAIPIVAEYQVDENFKWIYTVIAVVDMLGILDGVGVIYFASPDQEKRVLTVRDRHAKNLIQGYAGGKFDEVVVLGEKKEQ